MMRSSDFGRTFTEWVACSGHGGRLYERRLGVKIQTVTLYHVHASMLDVRGVLAINPDGFRRSYHGPVVIARGVDAGCPWCRNQLVHECLSCGQLSCCVYEEMHACAWCGVAGPVVYVPTGPPLAPEPYTPQPLRKRLWAAWIDFNEWIYDQWTRKNRPRTMREAEETYRKLKKP